jgi:hypothetical protein
MYIFPIRFALERLMEPTHGNVVFDRMFQGHVMLVTAMDSGTGEFYLVFSIAMAYHISDRVDRYGIESPGNERWFKLFLSVGITCGFQYVSIEVEGSFLRCPVVACGDARC